MSKALIISLIILGVFIVLILVLYFLGKKMQKKQAEQNALMEANKQTVSLLIIDKKRVKMKDAGFPQSVMAQAPKISRMMKVPVVKVKAGPQIMTLFCDEKIFDIVPIKKEVKATVSGMYLTDVKSLHGKLPQAPVKKKGAFKRFVEKIQEKGGAKPLK